MRQFITFLILLRQSGLLYYWHTALKKLIADNPNLCLTAIKYRSWREPAGDRILSHSRHLRLPDRYDAADEQCLAFRAHYRRKIHGRLHAFQGNSTKLGSVVRLIFSQNTV